MNQNDLTELERAIKDQLIEDTTGMLSWLNDQYSDVTIPTGRETAEEVVDVVTDPRLIVIMGEQSPSAEFMTAVEDHPLIRLQLARNGLQVFAQSMQTNLVPPDPPAGPRRGGPV